MINHNIMRLHISVHDSHAVTVIQGLKQQNDFHLILSACIHHKMYVLLDYKKSF